MSNLLTPGLIVAPRTIVRKVRELPLTGEVVVSQGDEVRADTIVARALRPGMLHIVRLPDRMGIEVREVLSGLKVKEGDLVAAGDLLCEYAGFFGLLKARAYSSVSGTVEFVAQGTGHVGIREAPSPITVDAYIGGRVVQVYVGKGVQIECACALVQGIFGVGGERRGELLQLGINRSEALDEHNLPKECQGKILYGGSSPSLAALRKAAQLGARGLIVGSIDDRALAGYLGYDIGIALTGDEDIPMTVIVTEGFGTIPMSERVCKLLSEHAGAIASINGATQVRAGAVRPEIVIPRTAKGEGAIDSAEPMRGLSLGSAIRIIRVPYFGLRAKVVELPNELRRLETGSLARVLRAELEDGRSVEVPRANVEVM